MECANFENSLLSKMPTSTWKGDCHNSFFFPLYLGLALEQNFHSVIQ